MAGINGITIKLWVSNPQESETDAFNRPHDSGEWVSVDDVLVAPLSDAEILDTVNLTGRKATYQLGIPKGDTHEWQSGGYVQFFGEYWRIVGHPTIGIDDMIPLRWNKKVKVESINGAEIRS